MDLWETHLHTYLSKLTFRGWRGCVGGYPGYTTMWTTERLLYSPTGGDGWVNGWVGVKLSVLGGCSFLQSPCCTRSVAPQSVCSSASKKLTGLQLGLSQAPSKVPVVNIWRSSQFSSSSNKSYHTHKHTQLSTMLLSTTLLSTTLLNYVWTVDAAWVGEPELQFLT